MNEGRKLVLFIRWKITCMKTSYIVLDLVNLMLRYICLPCICIATSNCISFLWPTNPQLMLATLQICKIGKCLPNCIICGWIGLNMCEMVSEKKLSAHLLIVLNIPVKFHWFPFSSRREMCRINFWGKKERKKERKKNNKNNNKKQSKHNMSPKLPLRDITSH